MAHETAGKIITTGDFKLPEDIADGIFKKAQTTSVLARLSKQRPQKYGVANQMILTGTPKAELVGENAEKSSTKPTFGNKTVLPYKVQVTMRTSDEVLWADEDYQMGILKELMNQAAIALGRSLDLIGIHKINPLTGNVAVQVKEGLVDVTDEITVDDGKYDEAIENACAAVIENGYSVNGIALDGKCSFGLATQRDLNGHKIYPELGLGQDTTSFLGLNAAVGDTVSGSNDLTEPSDYYAIVGDFQDAFRWGVQRVVKAKMIDTGDPDGLGDLSRTNEVAIRAEIVYGIGIMDTKAFAVVKNA